MFPMTFLQILRLFLHSVGLTLCAVITECVRVPMIACVSCRLICNMASLFVGPCGKC